MKIERALPPNYEAICDAFPWVYTTRGIIFAWDDRIYNPDDIVITPSLMAHEEVHSIRQEKAGGPEGWWAKYLTDPAFRYAEEIPAHIVEYTHIYQHFDRNKRRLYLSNIAERLAGPLYGHLTSKAMAMRLLKTGARTLLASPQPQPA